MHFDDFPFAWLLVHRTRNNHPNGDFVSDHDVLADKLSKNRYALFLAIVHS
jgi:hypothetical protein